jgi:hypothetical protein
VNTGSRWLLGGRRSRAEQPQHGIDEVTVIVDLGEWPVQHVECPTVGQTPANAPYDVCVLRCVAIPDGNSHLNYARQESGRGDMTDEELIIEFALTRLDNPNLDLEEIAALVVRRTGADRMLEFASRNLATRGELRGAVFPSAVEHVLRVVLTLRGPIN